MALSLPTQHDCCHASTSFCVGKEKHCEITWQGGLLPSGGSPAYAAHPFGPTQHDCCHLHLSVWANRSTVNELSRALAKWSTSFWWFPSICCRSLWPSHVDISPHFSCILKVEILILECGLHVDSDVHVAIFSSPERSVKNGEYPH